MAHLYEVQTNDGTYNVQTEHHHEDHAEPTFRRHLIETILNTVSGVAAGIIVHHYSYRGRR